MARFLAHIDDRLYTRLFVASKHYSLARDWMGQFSMPLMSKDSLHLAVAPSEGLTLITADEVMVKSAKALAVDAVLLSID